MRAPSPAVAAPIRRVEGRSRRPANLRHRQEVQEVLREMRKTWRLRPRRLGVGPSDLARSCQERPPGTDYVGRAYISFPRHSDAAHFHGWLTKAGIPSTLAEKKVKISRRSKPDAPPDEIVELDSGNVLFDPTDPVRIVEVLRGHLPVRS